jgi:hypothetical protein
MNDRIAGSAARLVLLLVLACALLGVGCDGNGRRNVEGEKYRELRSDALALYLEMHPLRGSRLGCGATDSLLYTYSAEEIGNSISRLSDLEDDLRTLTSSGFDMRRIEDSRLMLSWIRGERYALGELLYYRFNPLLYCWILEEALWSIPLRTTPPYGGELESYERRRLRIPALLRNAAENMTNPPGPHMELASQRIRRLLENMPELDSALRGRYERRVTLPDSVARSITGFLGFIEGTLSSQTRANMILGTENIAKIFRYGEMMELDPSGMIEEADKQIQRLRSELSSLRRDEHSSRHGSGSDLGQILEEIRERDAGTGLTENHPAEIGLVPVPVPQPELPKNVNLGLPVLEPKPVSLATTSTLSAYPCTQSLRYIENTSSESLLYHTLEALSARYEERRLCVEGDSVRTLLGSDLYIHVIRYLEIEDLIDAFPADRFSLRIELMEEKMRALARMSVLFELHAGTMTTDAAIEFLRDRTGISAEEAYRDIMTATYAPAAAYEGIALLYIDRMIKKAAERRDSTSPKRRVLQVLREHHHLSPAAAIEYLNP